MQQDFKSRSSLHMDCKTAVCSDTIIKVSTGGDIMDDPILFSHKKKKNHGRRPKVTSPSIEPTRVCRCGGREGVFFVTSLRCLKPMLPV